MKILNDFNVSVERALSEIDPNFMNLPGTVVCGTHSPHNIESLIEATRLAREKNEAFLGICFGHQIAAIEYARNVLGIKDATSEEFGEGTFVVVKNVEGLRVGMREGETYWNNYHVVPWLLEVWKKPSKTITVQFHPEYQSSKDRPHPILAKFIELCKK